MTVPKSCRAAVAANNDRVISNIVIYDRKDQPHNLSERVSTVEETIGHEVSSNRF